MICYTTQASEFNFLLLMQFLYIWFCIDLFLFSFFVQMAEGRTARIRLLDDRTFEISVQVGEHVS